MHELPDSIEGRLEAAMSLRGRKRLPVHFEAEPVFPAEVVHRLRSGRTDGDAQFDRVFPQRLRFISFVQWSPLEVAQLVAAWLGADMPRARFIDMGSGVGKLCLALSMISELRITGIEQRDYLVEIARQVALRNSLGARFVQGNCLDVDWKEHDVFFFYNPFQEHVATGEFFLIDDQVDLDRKFHVEYTERVTEELGRMPNGKRLITFHGFGGRIPGSYKLLRSALVGNGNLCMWEKMPLPELPAGSDDGKPGA